jgi:hypothetical protein
MKENEARDLLGMLKAATTQYPLDDETISFWIDGLTIMDADIATRAVMAGIRTWEHFPPWASFYEAYRMVQRQTKDQKHRAEIVEEGKWGYETPEWVWVWSWVRFHRDPAEDRPFPQQADFVDPAEAMTTEEYEILREEWIAIGRPKKETPLPAGGIR